MKENVENKYFYSIRDSFMPSTLFDVITMEQ